MSRKRIKIKKSEDTYWDYIANQELPRETTQANPDLLPEQEAQTNQDIIALQLKSIEEAPLTAYERLILDLLRGGMSKLSIAAKLERSPSTINGAIKLAAKKIQRTYTRLSLIYGWKGEI